MPKKQVNDATGGEAFEMPDSRASGSISSVRPTKSDYKALTRKHSCTDIICTVIFFVFIAFFIAVSVFAFKYGSPLDLVLPHDQAGRICGRSPGVEDKRYLLFYDFTRCLNFVSLKGFGCPTEQVCVSECPVRNAYEKIPGNKELLAEFCDPFNPAVCPTYVLKSKPIFGRCLPEIVTDISATLSDVITAEDPATGASVPIEAGASQLTIGKLKDAVKYIKNLLDLKGTFELAYEDFANSYWLVLIGLGIGIVLAFVWMLLLRFIIKPMVYLSILAIICLLGFSTGFCVVEYLALRKENSTSSSDKFTFEKVYDLKYMTGLKDTWLVLSIISGVVLLIVLLILLFLRKRIIFACEIIKETSKAVVAIPMSLIWPVVPIALHVGIVVYCVAVALFMASSGIQLFKVVRFDNATQSTPSWLKEPESFRIDLRKELYQEGDYCFPEEFYKAKNQTMDGSLDGLECTFYEYGFDTKLPLEIGSETANKYYTKLVEFVNEYQWLPQVFILFMFFWLSAFVVGLNQMTLAGSFGIWYWSGFDKADKRMKSKQPIFTLFTSFGRAIFFHIGTIAFGSLLIAIVKIIRIVLEYVSHKAKNNTNDSKIVKFLACCCKCCLYCLEKILKFLNKYAFIITAVYSLNFCRAAAKAFKLITSNAVRLVVVDKISNFLFFLSNLAITSLVGVLAFYFFTKRIPIDAITKFSPDLNFYVIPIILVIIATFVINKIFFDVFNLGVDSILMCVLIDLDKNNGSKEKPYFMPKSLQRTLNKKNVI